MVPGEQQLGRYHLLKQIARGGMGEIYLAEDASINRQVAIKVMRSEAELPGEGRSSDAARLSEREAKAVAKLDHPHILPLYDYGEQQQGKFILTYLVMPYRPEGSLAAWLEQRGPNHPLSLEDVERILTQTASALQYTHDHQLIHRDVKPSNLLIRANREYPYRPDILVSDFGIARLSTMISDTSLGIRGTPNYMAPEQWAGTPLPASDQYALAVMAYELITGELPFKGNPMQIMYAHTHTPPPLPSSLVPGLPPALDAVLLRALAKKPEDRFPTIISFAQTFQQVIRDTFSGRLSLNNPYIIQNSYSTANSPDFYTTLAISEAEARNGSRRELMLPDGSKLVASIPSGVYNGQILTLNGANSAVGEATSNIVHLKLSVLAVPQKNNSNQRMLPSNDVLNSLSGTAIVGSIHDSFPLASIPGSTSARLPQANTKNVPAYNHSHVESKPLSPIPDPQTPPSLNPSVIPFHTPSLLPHTRQAVPGSALLAPLNQNATVRPLPGRTRKRAHGLLVLLIVIALLLILSGGALAYMLNNGLIGTGRGNSNYGATATSSINLAATQTALTTIHLDKQSTSTVIAQGTANAQSTAGAQASATAQVQATVTASTDNPYGGTLALTDPLVNNSQGHNWAVNGNATVGSSCGFADGAYHMIVPVIYSRVCLGSSTSFGNFALQVQMTFSKAEQHFGAGGVVFRATSSGQYYVLTIYANGLYSFFSCDSTSNCAHDIAGYPGPAQIPTFQYGLNQTNTIAIVAQNNSFTFYTNGQKFAGPITDSSYSSAGAIGFYALGSTANGVTVPTDVAYTNLKVWQLE